MEGASSSSNEQWVISIKHRLQEKIKGYANPAAFGYNSEGRTIFRVSKRMKDSLEGRDKFFYTPELMSLGLFHRPEHYDIPRKGEDLKVQVAGAFLTSIYTNERYRRKTLASFGQQFPESESTLGPTPSGVAEPSKTENGPASDVENSVESSVHFLSESWREQVLNEAWSEHVWKDLCDQVVGEIDFRATLDLYDLQGRDRISADESTEVLRSALTLDAIVLACILLYSFTSDLSPFPLIHDCFERGAFHFADFLQLENQIPLFFHLKVFKILCTADIRHSEDVLNSSCAAAARHHTKHLPGYDRAQDSALIDQLEAEGMFLKCDHLLDCIALILRLPEDRGQDTEEQREPWTKMSRCTRVRKSGTECIGRIRGGMSRAKVLILNLERVLLCGIIRGHLRYMSRAVAAPWRPPLEAQVFKIPSATQLREAGIRIRGCSRRGGFDMLPVFKQGWLTATLDIPRLPYFYINPTETLWRNIVAYELAIRPPKTSYKPKSYKHQESQLYCFLMLLECLLDSKEDVLLLTQGKKPILPEGYHSTPEKFVERLNKIFIGHPMIANKRWLILRDQINSYQKQKYRRMILEFLRTNFGKPWLVISVVAATILLILTFLQAIYAILLYYDPK